MRYEVAIGTALCSALGPHICIQTQPS